MTSPEVSQHKIKFELPEVTLGDQKHGIIFSAANQTAFQLIYLETILNILKAKDLITKRKGKAFQSLQIKSHPLSSMQKISTSFLFILMDFFFFFFFKLQEYTTGVPVPKNPDNPDEVKI